MPDMKKKKKKGCDDISQWIGKRKLQQIQKKKVVKLKTGPTLNSLIFPRNA